MQKFDADFYRLKAAAADLVARCGGGRRSAEITGLSPAMISNICQRDQAAMLSLFAKLRLELDCGAPLVSAVEAELLGHRLERIGGTPAAGGSPLDAHAAVMREVGDLCGAFAEAQRDGRYTRTDAAAVDRALADLVAEIERFRRVNAAALAGGAL